MTTPFHSDQRTFADILAPLAVGRTAVVGAALELDLLTADERLEVGDIDRRIGETFDSVFVDAATWRGIGPAGIEALSRTVADRGRIVFVAPDPGQPVLDLIPDGWSLQGIYESDAGVVTVVGPATAPGAIEDMEQVLMAARRRENALRRQNVDRELLVSDLQRDLRATRSDLEVVTSNLEASREAAQAELNAAESEIARLVSRLESSEDRLTTANARISSLQSEMRTERTRLSSEVDRLSRNLAKKDARIRRLEHERDVVNWKLASLKNRKWWRLGPVLKGFARRPWRVVANLRALRAWMRPTPALPRPTKRSPAQKAQPETRVEPAPEAEPSQIPELPPIVQVVSAPLSLARRPLRPQPREVRMAVIMDEMSQAGFDPECKLIQFTPETWLETLSRQPPHLLMVESAWKGNGGSWEYKVGSYSYPDSIGLPHLTSLVDWCRSHDIPTVFWNKEDPVHFGKFKEAAALFDVALTTDADLLQAYTELPGVGERRVGALPFAAQPTLHNPIDSLEGRDPRPVFAGTFYRNRHEERQRQMEMLLDAALPFGLVIYDRMAGQVTDSFGYPERFQSSIVGAVPYAEMVQVYRRHKVFLNTNSITASPTMFSRRVFELLACGTPVVSTPSAGVTSMFGDVVRVVEDADEAREAISTILDDEAKWRDTLRRGIVAVSEGHLYRDRLQTVLDAAGVDYETRDDRLALVCDTGAIGHIEAIVDAARRHAPDAIVVVNEQHGDELKSTLARAPVDVAVEGSESAAWYGPVSSPDHVAVAAQMVKIARLVESEIIGLARRPEDEHRFVTALADGPHIIASRAWRASKDVTTLARRGHPIYAIVPVL